MKRFSFPLTVSLVAVGGLMLAAVWHLSSGTSNIDDTTDLSVSTQLTAARCQLQPGQTAAFRLNSTVTAAGQSDHFSGLMSWEVVQTTAGSARVRAAFSTVVLTQQMTLPEERSESPTARPFYLVIGTDCSILKRAFAPTWELKSRMMISTLLDNFAFRLPPAQSAIQTGIPSASQNGKQVSNQPRKWSAEATDGLGNYTASFELETVSPLTIQRHKTAHQARGEAAGFGIDIHLDQADAVAVFSPAAPIWWSSISGQEAVTLRTPGQPGITMSQHFTLQRADQLFSPVPPLDWNKADFSDPYDVPVQMAELTTTHQSYDEAHQAFITAIQEKPPRYYDAALELAAWLKQHPDDVAQIVAELLADLDDNARPTAFFALQLSGTDEARTALSELISDDALSVADQARAASALADLGTPRRDVVDLLLQRSESNDMAANVSLLAIGSMMPRIDKTELREHVIQSLQQRQNEVSNVADELLVLDAMGNSGDAAFVDTLTDSLSDDTSAVRRHAANALAKLPPQQASAALLTQLSVEQDPKVTTTLVKALTSAGTPMADVLPALSQRLTSGGDNQRVAIVDLLGRQNTDAAQQLLVQQFKRETNAHIQQQIGRYVSAGALR